MTAIGEQSLRWFSAERAVAEPDLNAMVRDYSGLLYRVALSLLRNPAEAEDVVQDAFLRVLQRRKQLASVVDLRPWLVRIAWNLAIDRIRRQRPAADGRRFRCRPRLGQHPCRRRLFTEAAGIRHVLAAMEGLPQHERQALLLSAMEELSTAEIAVVLGKSESSVRSLLFRARTHLRQRLGD